MNILSFETSHAEASVALLSDSGMFESRIISNKKHEETVMPAVNSLLEANDINPCDLDLVAVDIGPGSFTGIRIGICHANAIADVAQIPCIGICSLDAIAHICFKGCTIGISIDAGNDNCYCAIYNSEFERIYGPVSETYPEFQKHVLDHHCLTIIDKDSLSFPTASTIAQLAYKYISKNDNGLLRASPLYLRPSQAERKHNT